MQRRSGPTRRTLLRWLVLVGFGMRGRAADAAPRPAGRSKRSVGHLLRRPDSAAVLGREYLRLRTEEANAPALARRLGLPGLDLASLDPFEKSSLKGEILRRHRDDFECGRVVDVHGWILSVTELRLCALVSLQGD